MRSVSASRLPKSASSSSIYSGGFTPYSSLTKRSSGVAEGGSWGSSRFSAAPMSLSPDLPMSPASRHRKVSAAQNANPTLMHASENAHWLSRNSVGPPEKTAWMINDKGNRVWFSFEHTPTLFPVQETRFYKPKVHKLDFLGKKEDTKGRDLWRKEGKGYYTHQDMRKLLADSIKERWLQHWHW